MLAQWMEQNAASNSECNMATSLWSVEASRCYHAGSPLVILKGTTPWMPYPAPPQEGTLAGQDGPTLRPRLGYSGAYLNLPWTQCGFPWAVP